MSNRDFVQRVWDSVGDVLAEEGFALGGGLAMRAHGFVDRETQDIDAFRKDPILSQPEAFDRAEARLTAKLQADGLVVAKTKDKDFERGYDVSDPATGDETKIDLGRDRLPSAFIEIPGYGVVINRDDMAGMKMRALYERHAERDYIDYDAMRRLGPWSAEDLVGLLDRTGSIDAPADGDWRPKLAQVLSSADVYADEVILEDLGVDGPDELFQRLRGYAAEHQPALETQKVDAAASPLQALIGLHASGKLSGDRKTQDTPDAERRREMQRLEDDVRSRAASLDHGDDSEDFERS